MSDEEQIKLLYEKMYEAMIEKNAEALYNVLSEQFYLHHMTGMKQNKQEYIEAIVNGTLNYYSVTHENIDVRMKGDTVKVVGDSRVLAAVFGGGKNTWRLRQTMLLHKENGRWMFDEAVASTY